MRRPARRTTRRRACLGPANFKSSPVAAGGHLYLSTEEGTVVVARLGDRFDVVSVNAFSDESFISTPAIVGGDIYLRSRTHLYRISEQR